MIILDGEAHGQAKHDTYQGLTLRHPQEAHTRTSSLLPDYATSEAQHWKVTQSDEQPKPLRFDSRIWKGALYALAVYIFLSLVIVTPILLTRSKKEYYQQNLGQPGPGSLWAVDNQVFSIPLQLSPAGAMTLDANKTCNVWNSTTPWNNTSKLEFTLPPTGLLTIRSNVTYNTFTPDQITGSLSVSMNEDLKAKFVYFSVQVQFSSEEIRQQTHVCYSRTDTDRGVSIFVPTNLGSMDNLNFKIEVILPHEATVDSLVTYLPMLTQNFDDLRPFSVNEFYIEGANQPITCNFLQAPLISVKNVEGSIQGDFNVTSALNLDSIKGSITSNITLTQPTFCTQPIFLTLDTGDSAIQANIVLDSLASSSSLTSSAYIAKVSTFNRPLDLNISYRTNAASLPLHLQVQNNLAESTITMDATYQGSFSATTKLSQVTVTDAGVSPGDTPPGVKGSRTIDYDQNTGDIASGWIGWGARPMSNSYMKQSYVDIISALGPVTLKFG